MVENFGSYIKHERELRGIPLEEISGKTKVHIRFLTALEENSFDELPSEVFIKGYIRAYANTIGSDVEEMLNVYKESVELGNQENLPQETSNTEFKTFLAYGLLIFLVAGILFGVGILIKNGIGNSSGKSEGEKTSLLQMPVMEKNINAQEEDSSEPEVLAQEYSVPGNPSDPLSGKEDEDAKKTPSPQESVAVTIQAPSTSPPDLDIQNPANIEKPLRLSIRAKEISWFNMTIDNFKAVDFILQAGTTETFWGNETIRLTVGNKTGVELFLNSKALVLPKSNDNVVKDFFINSKLIE